MRFQIFKSGNEKAEIHVQCIQCGVLGPPADAFNTALRRAMAIEWVTIKDGRQTTSPTLPEPEIPLDEMLLEGPDPGLTPSQEQAIFGKIAEMRSGEDTPDSFTLEVRSVSCKPHDTYAVCKRCRGEFPEAE